MTQAIPSCRLEHIQPYIDFLQGIGAPVERALLRNRLPVLRPAIPNAYLPLGPVAGFLESMSRSQGIDDLALRAVGSLRIDHLGRYFVDRAKNAPTLLAALIHFRRLAPLEDTNTSVWITSRGKDISLSMSSRYPFNQYVLAIQSRHLLVTLIAIVRGFAGRDWIPDEYGLQSDYPAGAYAEACFPDTRSHYRQRATWICIPHELLSLPPSFDTKGPSPDRKNTRVQGGPMDFRESVKRVVAGYLRDRYPCVKFVASIVGLSPRTLQRRLGKCGTSYSELVLQTRYEAATDMLHDQDRKITDIAYDLGYRDPAHFSRAFSRIGGVSPQAFRKRGSTPVTASGVTDRSS